jgi:tungstate transport system substrate-binding protein
MKKWISLMLVAAMLALTLPAVAVAAPASQAVTCEEEPVVLKDDWLSKLADKYYGNPLAYPAIREATNRLHASDSSYAFIQNDDLIEVGWQLCVPPADQAQAILDELATNQSVASQPPARLVLATTTSTDDSGLLKYILPDFEAKYNARVEVIAVGTGQALELGRNGDADVVLVHARSQEDAFVADGDGVNRQDVMYNDFVIVGPSDDPAGIRGMTDAATAFARLAETGSTFVSRGDNSGTHTKEKTIWTKAGVEPAGDWYISAGQGMGAVLTMANEQLAYTLSDRATYLARTLEGIDLVILVEGDPLLFNPYGVIAVNPDQHPNVNYDLAMQFIQWITSIETQKLIESFGVAEFGQPLFTPDSEAWRAANQTG